MVGKVALYTLISTLLIGAMSLIAEESGAHFGPQPPVAAFTGASQGWDGRQGGTWGGGGASGYVSGASSGYGAGGGSTWGGGGYSGGGPYVSGASRGYGGGGGYDDDDDDHRFKGFDHDDGWDDD